MKTIFTKDDLKKAYEDGSNKRTWFDFPLCDTPKPDSVTLPSFERWFEKMYPSIKEFNDYDEFDNFMEEIIQSRNPIFVNDKRFDKRRKWDTMADIFDNNFPVTYKLVDDKWYIYF